MLTELLGMTVVMLAPQNLFPQLAGSNFFEFDKYQTGMEVARFWVVAISTFFVMAGLCLLPSTPASTKKAVAFGMSWYHVLITGVLAQRALHFPKNGAQKDYIVHLGACGLHIFMFFITFLFMVTTDSSVKKNPFTGKKSN
eukprot:CFRG4892T1